MGTVFANLSGESLMRFDPTVFKMKMAEFMGKGMGIVLCAHEEFELRGAIAGVIYENVFDGALCATELFWYVWPGAIKGRARAAGRVRGVGRASGLYSRDDGIDASQRVWQAGHLLCQAWVHGVRDSLCKADMKPHLIVVDEVFPTGEFLLLREYAWQLEYKDKKGPDDIIYKDIGVPVPESAREQLVHGLSWLMGYRVVLTIMSLPALG